MSPYPLINMKRILLLFQACLLVSCNEALQDFQPIDCDPTNNSGNANISRVFKPCRQYIYTAKYWDPDYNLISKERIWMMATGNGWEQQQELQDELIIQYSFDSTQIDRIGQYSLNPGYSNWTRKETTGIIENGSKTWMHPFRSNQYMFTEVAAFPNVELPLTLGKTWTSEISMLDGWGVWANTTLDHTYEVVDYELVETGFGDLEAWHVRATTTSEFGTSVHDFWYHDEYGFIRMFIKNYEGQMLQFDLAEVRE